MVKSTLNVEHKSYKNIDEQITYLYESKKIGLTDTLATS